jgi:hypothetical protein
LFDSDVEKAETDAVLLYPQELFLVWNVAIYTMQNPEEQFGEELIMYFPTTAVATNTFVSTRSSVKRLLTTCIK